MNIAAAREEASIIVTLLAARLNTIAHSNECDSSTHQARKELELVRKRWQRVIDQRQLERPGKPRFAIHEREAIQSRLDKIILETDAAIEAVAIAWQRRNSGQTGGSLT